MNEFLIYSGKNNILLTHFACLQNTVFNMRKKNSSIKILYETN